MLVPSIARNATKKLNRYSVLGHLNLKAETYRTENTNISLRSKSRQHSQTSVSFRTSPYVSQRDEAKPSLSSSLFSHTINHSLTTKRAFHTASPKNESSQHFISQYIAPDTNTKIAILDPRDYPKIWKQYVTSLNKKYAQYDIYNVSSQMLEGPGRTLLAVAFDCDSGEMVGGTRIEGPFHSSTESPSIKDIAGLNTSSSIQKSLRTVKQELEEKIIQSNGKGIFECRGLWTTRKGVSKPLGRALSHMKWLMDAPFLFGMSPTFHQICSNNGFEVMSKNDKNSPVFFPYPDERYSSYPAIQSPKYMDNLDDYSRQLTKYERWVLTPAKARFQESKKEFNSTAETDMPNKDDIWYPEILVDDDPRVQQLRETEHIEMVDHVPVLHKELSENILPRVTDPLILNEPPQWVHFPWRNLAVRVLGPKGYKLLRSDRNRYKLTAEEIETLSMRSVGVIGMSVGHSSAVGLAQEGLCGHLNLADFDILELPNLNRMPVSIAELGKNKTSLTARRIAEIDPYISMDVFREGVTEENISHFMKNMDCIVEECDSLDIKVLARVEASKQKIPVIMETSDIGCLDVERFDVEPERAPFHGLAGNSIMNDLKGLSTAEKVPFIRKILETEKVSERMKASIGEINQTISSFPQLAREISLGSALISTAVHQLFLDPANLRSGRSRTNLKDAVENLADPSHTIDEQFTIESQSIPSLSTTIGESDELPDEDIDEVA